MVNKASYKVHHLTRVEGHGDITVEIEDGELRDVKFPIVEAPRFFEVLLRGLHYEEVTHIASRICGICAIAHRTAALVATEAAFGVDVSEQTRLLRRLALNGEVMGSHILHVYFLAAPDFLNVPSVFDLVSTRPEIIRCAMGLKKLAYDLCAAVVGRHTHPVGMRVGGFSFAHSERELESMRSRLLEAADDLEATVELFKTIELPQFERETEYVSLKHPEEYAFYEGGIHSSAGETVGGSHYREIIKEYVVPYSTAKHARWHKPQYMVGALARNNNNFKQLSPLSKAAAADLGLRIPSFNPFMITLAQIVEYIHCQQQSIALIEELLEQGIEAEDEQVEVKPRGNGLGVAVVEAPRGILFHEYEYDGEGKCLAANLIIPTAQNLANIEADMRGFVPQILQESKESIVHKLEMLVRAYDPCISCSTHVVTID
jgi:coenzyme F420-reducing hydrogenase alpha subunit